MIESYFELKFFLQNKKINKSPYKVLFLNGQFGKKKNTLDLARDNFLIKYLHIITKIYNI